MTFQAVPGEWNDYVVSDYVMQTKGMITGFERSAYGHFAKRAAMENPAIGRIIDGGPYVGSSTLAFAEGLLRAGRPISDITGVINSYDLFVATEGMIQFYPFGEPVSPGDDFSRFFERNLGLFAQCAVMHKGDIRRARAPDGLVRICFADVLWGWDICAHFMQEFVGKCAAGESILIHQDFVYPFYPWIPLTMGVNTDLFVFADEVPYSTAIFNVVGDPSKPRVLHPTELTLSEASAIFDGFAAKLSRFGQGCMFISKAVYALSLGHQQEARAIMDAVVRDYSDEPLVAQYFAPMNDAIQAGAVHIGI